jgi:hypothetical protein
MEKSMVSVLVVANAGGGVAIAMWCESGYQGVGNSVQIGCGVAVVVDVK